MSGWVPRPIPSSPKLTLWLEVSSSQEEESTCGEHPCSSAHHACRPLLQGSSTKKNCWVALTCRFALDVIYVRVNHLVTSHVSHPAMSLLLLIFVPLTEEKTTCGKSSTGKERWSSHATGDEDDGALLLWTILILLTQEELGPGRV